MNWIKGISPTIRILITAIVLILLPAAVLSYFGFVSVNERARNLESEYRGTLLLVRDRIEQEILQQEQNFRSSIGNTLPEYGDRDLYSKWLQSVESGNPWLKHPFLIQPDGKIITPFLFIDASNPPEASLNSAAVVGLFQRAEKAEFSGKDLQHARRFYTEALALSQSAGDQAILLSRAARCDFKLGEYRTGINRYRKLLGISHPGVTVGGIPAFVVALTQIADGCAAVKDNQGRFNALMELYERLTKHSSEISADQCSYYLKQSAEELDVKADPHSEKLTELAQRSAGLLKDIRRLEWARSTLLPQISARSNENSGRLPPGHVIEKYDGASLQFGYFQLRASSKETADTLAYELDGDRIVSDLLPKILNKVDLGHNAGIGILDEAGKSRFTQMGYIGSTYLAAASFDEILPRWKVVMVNPEGKSVDELVSREKWSFLALLAGTFLVMITGISLTVRSAAHELQLSRLKSEFVSNVSHEFKTPLSLIRMFGETLESGMVQDDEKRGEFYRIIRSESERLTRLINNVLDFSRIEAGVKRYNFREAEIGGIIRKALDAYRLEIRNLGFNIDSRLPSKPIAARIDPDAICEALLNLLDNAAKYSGEDKKIVVRLESSESWVRISVSDHGIGIPGDELNSIFDKYYRSRTQKTGETAGSGLGLTLVKHIIESHGGRVEVESMVNEGSTFTLLIPIS